MNNNRMSEQSAFLTQPDQPQKEAQIQFSLLTSDLIVFHRVSDWSKYFQEDVL